MRTRWLWLALLVVACTPSTQPVSFPVNRCDDHTPCKEGICNRDVGRCVDNQRRPPYSIVLQAVAVGNQPDLPARYTFESLQFGENLTSHPLVVPSAVRVRGTVSTPSKPILAEVSFSPRADDTGTPAQGYPLATTVVSSREELPAGEIENLAVRLPPSTLFDVNIQPVGEKSAGLPPVQTTFMTGSADDAASFSYTYEDVQTIHQVLVDESTLSPQAGRWVRCRNATTQKIISSVAQTAADGSFALGFMPDALKDPYVLEVGLHSDDPWSEVVRVSSARIDPTGHTPVVMPTVPERVRLVGSVEAAGADANTVRGVPSAELTFVSKFPVPATMGELHDRDWCRSHQTGDTTAAFSCTTTQSAISDAQGSFQIDLLPGDYEVFISPGPDSSDPAQLSTTMRALLIETQPAHASQGPWAFQLGPATLLTGSLETSDGTPLPYVTVRTMALSLVGLLGDVAAYNRSASAVTDAKGTFSMAVDRGYYDVLAQPPKDSGYPVLFRPNLDFDPGRTKTIDKSGLTMHLPQYIAGVISREQGGPLANMEVDAFAIVDDLRGFKRAVLLASDVSDAHGNYALALPTSIKDTGPDH